MEKNTSTDDPEALPEWHATCAAAKSGAAAAWRRRGEHTLGSYYERSAERHASTARLLRSLPKA